MTLGDRVKALEERQNILEAGEVRFQRLLKEWADETTKNVNERVSAIIKETLKNMELMREHFESHYLDKKKREEYASKRKTNRYKEYDT